MPWPIIKRLIPHQLAEAESVSLLKRTCVSLRRAMRITAGARFNASKRLSDHDKRLNVSVAVLSFYIIAISVFQLAFDLQDSADRALSLISITASIGVLAMALIQFASSDAVHAEQHHKCALDIEEIRRDLDVLLIQPNPDKLLSIINRYNSVLQNSNLNHADDDMFLYVCTRPELQFNFSPTDILFLKTRAWIGARIPYIITFFGGIIIASMLLYIALNETN